MVDIGLSRTKSADALVLTVRPIVLIYATHGVSGVEWTHYRHPLPEHVYDVYMLLERSEFNSPYRRLIL